MSKFLPVLNVHLRQSNVKKEGISKTPQDALETIWGRNPSRGREERKKFVLGAILAVLTADQREAGEAKPPLGELEAVSGFEGKGPGLGGPAYKLVPGWVREGTPLPRGEGAPEAHRLNGGKRGFSPPPGAGGAAVAAPLYSTQRVFHIFTEFTAPTRYLLY